MVVNGSPRISIDNPWMSKDSPWTPMGSQWIALRDPWVPWKIHRHQQIIHAHPCIICGDVWMRQREGSGECHLFAFFDMGEGFQGNLGVLQGQAKIACNRFLDCLLTFR